MTAEYVPTAEQRALVESAAAFGLTQADIAQPHTWSIGGKNGVLVTRARPRLVNIIRRMRQQEFFGRPLVALSAGQALGRQR